METPVVLALLTVVGSLIGVLQIRANARVKDIERRQQQDKRAAETRIKELELRQDETKAQSAQALELTKLLDKSVQYQHETAVASRQTADTIGESTLELTKLTKSVEDMSARQQTRMEDWDDRTRDTMTTVLRSFQATEQSLRTLIEGQNASAGKLQQVVDIIEELRSIPTRTEAIVNAAFVRIEAIVKSLAIPPVNEQSVNVTVEETPK